MFKKIFESLSARFKKFVGDEKAEAATTLFISLAVGLVAFMIVLIITSSVVSTATQYQVVTNETWNTSTGNIYIQLGNATIINNSEYVGNSSYTATKYLNYTINNTDGTIMANWQSLGAGPNDALGLMNHTVYNISYQYQAAGYITDSMTRLIVGFLPLLLSVGALVMVGAVVTKLML